MKLRQNPLQAIFSDSKAFCIPRILAVFEQRGVFQQPRDSSTASRDPPVPSTISLDWSSLKCLLVGQPKDFARCTKRSFSLTKESSSMTWRNTDVTSSRFARKAVFLLGLTP